MENLHFPGNQSAEARLDEIANLLRAGRKIDAIKVYRAVTGASLRDAKAAVEHLELYGTLAGATSQFEVVPQPASVVEMDPQSVLLAEIAQLISRGQKIQAIKVYRQHTGTGLADAKNAVDRIEQMIRMQGL